MTRCLLGGLAVLLPAVLTLYILWLLFRIVGAVVAAPVDLVAGNLFGRNLGTMTTALVGVAATVGVLLAAGATAQRLGPAVFHRIEAAAFRRLPVARGIHAAVRQLFDLFFADGGAHRGVGLVEYPRTGMYALCFITSREPWRANDDRGTRLLSVYRPTTPNPTSGCLYGGRGGAYRDLRREHRHARRAAPTAGETRGVAFRGPSLSAGGQHEGRCAVIR